MRQKTYKPAKRDWALDSGGFSELSMFGTWTTRPSAYASAVRRYCSEIGRLCWAAVQDWMCEPAILAKTGLTISEHQRRTLKSYLTLRDLAPEVLWVPVIQGWALSDYLRHCDLYAAAGVELANLETVGVGSVCRRQGTAEGIKIFKRLSQLGLRLHGFGLKTLALRRLSNVVRSADSMAWSYAARRRRIRLKGCVHSCCNNCRRWAEQWRVEVHRQYDDQLWLFCSDA